MEPTVLIQTATSALYRAAKGKVDENVTPNWPCFDAQQAVEMMLKAALLSENSSFPKIHDLDELRDLLSDGWTVKKTHPNLSELSQWSTAGRYVEDFSSLTDDVVDRAIATAQKVYSSLLIDLKDRGVV